MTAFKKFSSCGLALVCSLLLLSSLSHAAQLDIPGPNGSGAFGTSVTVLPNGNFVVTDPGFDRLGPTVLNVGAVYLYSASGTLISTLTGSTANDAVGTTVTVLANGNFVVRSGTWNGSRGAVTWGSATSGVTGTVSASNSLVGGTADDKVGQSGIIALSNGDYVVASPNWDTTGPAVSDVGAVTWGRGTIGVKGLVSGSNSLIGRAAGDNVGTEVTALSNGNYVVASPNWDSPGPGSVSNVGAVTWGNGRTAISGTVTATNSLVGVSANDSVGGTGVTALSNGNYVVRSQFWDATGPTVSDVGAVTWGDGSGGTVGSVSSGNSLVGDKGDDQVGGTGVTALSNGNFVVRSASWDGSGVNLGAVTWGNGSGGGGAVVSSSNSLVGGSAFDQVGSSGVTALTNGNYVVVSESWDSIGPGSVSNVGAVTWCRGFGGPVGLVSISNSLTGNNADDYLGSGVTALSNGNYVVSSPNVSTFGSARYGAATWVDGRSGSTGFSLRGSANDQVGSGGVTALNNGNYVVSSPNVSSLRGAATWGDGSIGTGGLVSSSNSLTGFSMGDLVGTVTALRNGNYVVSTPSWNASSSLLTQNEGAVTWGDGFSGTTGLVSNLNSLVGGSRNDSVGTEITALSNGNYVVSSPFWNTVSVGDVGAVTLGDGSGGTVGLVTASNSLVGATANDNVASDVTALGNGNYVVRSQNWDATAPITTDSGAITRGIGSGVTTGLISPSNSVLGTAASAGGSMVFDYDLTRAHLIVGRRANNIVTIFFDQAAPTATTLPASLVTPTTATLNATVDPNDGSTTVAFDYGPTIAYGSTASATPSPLTGAGAQTVSVALSGLTANATYHFRIRATNTSGVTLGLNQSFVARMAGLQVGSVTLPATVDSVFFPPGGAPRSNAATRVNFAQAFASVPVVIVQVGNQSGDPQSVRVTNITSSSFDMLQVESPGFLCTSCDARGPATTVHWLAALRGSYRLSSTGTGVLLKVDRFSSSAHQRNISSGFSGWPSVSVDSVLFSTAFPGGDTFGNIPVVLSTVQSWNQSNEGFNLDLFGTTPALRGTSAPWATTSVSSVTKMGFDIALEASEVDDDDQDGNGFAASETLGYVAIESGVSVKLAPLGSGGSMVGLATGLSTATDECSGTSLAFPSGTPVVASNLRGFAGKQTRTEADGGWLRRCAMGASAPNVSMSVRVDEDTDIDAERTHGNETIGIAIFGDDFSTTPVTLAQAQVQRQGNNLALSFASATEIGHLGYRIWGRTSEAADWQVLTPNLLMSNTGDGFAGKDYSQTLPGQIERIPVTEVRIEDVDLLGRSRFHPALAVGASIGAVPVDVPLDWSAIRAANAATPQRSLRGTNAQALLEVTQDGIYRVRFEALENLGFATGTPASQIALLDDGQPVLRHLSCSTLGAGCFIEFVGRKRESLYGATNVYTLKLDANAARPVSGGALFNDNSPVGTVPGEVREAANRAYSFSAPGSDPWFDQRLVATSAPVELTRTFALLGRSAGAVTLSVDIWGGTDFAGDSPDHSVALLINGQLLATRRFDGLTAQRIEAPIPENLLQASNTLSLRVLADTGYSADVVLLDGYSVRYPRRSQASNGVLQVGELSQPSTLADSLFSSNFEDSTRSGMLLEGVQANSVLWSQIGDQIHRDTVKSDARVDSTASALHLSPSSSITELSPRASIDIQPNNSPVDYLIVSHPLFAAELAPLIALQQSRGYSVRVLSTDAIYAERSDYAAGPEAIRAAIAAINPRFVLLVGGDSYDYHDYLGIGSQSYVPTFYRAADPIVRFAPSDHPFVDANSDGIPERAIGRIPARTVAELRLALDSILARGNIPASRYFATAGGSAANEHFGLHSRTLLSYLRQGQSTEFALVDELGSAVTKDKARAALAGSADWINYLGHSSPNRWAFDNLLDTNQLASINRGGLPAVVSQWGCWNNYFVLPSQDTMSHALLLRSNRLASAVIGSSSLAEDASHLALATRFFDVVEDGRIGDVSPLVINTLGEALRDAKSDLMQRSPEFVESVYSITLFGDPAAPLR